MFYPHITIADTNYLGRGVLLCVTTLGRRAVLRAVLATRMNDPWYQERPNSIFLPGDYIDTKYGDRTMMFVEDMGREVVRNINTVKFDAYIAKIMHGANHDDEQLHHFAKFAMEVNGEEYNYE